MAAAPVGPIIIIFYFLKKSISILISREEEGDGNFMSRRLSTAGYTHAHGAFIQLTPGVLLLYAIVRSRLNGSRGKRVNAHTRKKK